MPITEAQEIGQVEAQRRAHAQNKRYPLLINVDDGRLVPNVPQLGGRTEIRAQDGRLLRTAILAHPRYRVYMGDPKAPLEERMRLLATSGFGVHNPVIDPDAPRNAVVAESFDISKASKQELVAFAEKQYGTTLDPNKHHATLRAEVRQLAANAGDLAGDLAG